MNQPKPDHVFSIESEDGPTWYVSVATPRGVILYRQGCLGPPPHEARGDCEWGLIVDDDGKLFEVKLWPGYYDIDEYECTDVLIEHGPAEAFYVRVTAAQLFMSSIAGEADSDALTKKYVAREQANGHDTFARVREYAEQLDASKHERGITRDFPKL